ncbi:MAG: outer membrane beta-barrel protein [Sphingobacteriaceae bacterium]|nr:outer membrane beta-barrel protein [Sphingobacteriaceae bacterium]
MKYVINGNFLLGNRYTKSFVLFTMLLAFSFSSIKAQEKVKFNGMVKDITNQQPIPYATVQLIRNNDTKTVVFNSYSDTNGQFTINADTGIYILSITFFGYTTLNNSLKFYHGMPSDINLFLMKPSVKQLAQINIIGQKALITQDKDKLIYNVEQEPSAKSENLTDIFRKIPMLSVDGEGNIQLNGQTNYKVLLNGRETAMFALNVKDALRGFPGAVVSKIEVITAPSAKYDAEGIGGLINIITKKTVLGYNGYLSSYYSNINYQSSSNFSIQSGKFAMTGTYFLSGNYNNKSQITSETTPLKSAAYQKRFLEGERSADRFSNNGLLETSYNIDSLQTIVAYANISGGNNKNKLSQNITTQFAGTATQYDLFDQNIRNNFPSFGIGSDFIKKFIGSPDKELSFRFNGQFSKNDGLNNSLMNTASSDLFMQNESYSKNREYTVQTDFIQPFTKSMKLETGVKFVFRNAKANYLSLRKTDENLPFEPDYSNSDNFAYQQQVYSGYGSLSFTLKKLNFRTGIRLENTSVNGNFFSSNTEVRQNYTTLIPDFSANTKLGKNYTIVLSYTKRLQRPYINTLNPFVNNNDPLNISYGNPDLSAQTIHTISLQNRLLKGVNFITFGLSASYSGNMIVQYTTFNELNGVSTTQYGNIGKNREVSAQLTLSTSLKKFGGGINSILRYNKIENTIISTQMEQGFSWQVAMYFNYKIIKSFSISGNGGIDRPVYSLINTLNTFPFYQINFGYKFFNERLSTTINFNKFFNKWRTNRSFTEDANFRIQSTNTTPYRVTYIGFTYNFGKLKENLSKKRGVNNDDLINN